MKKIICAGLLAAVMAVGSTQVGASANVPKAEETPRPAKEFTLSTVRGRTVSLKDYRGKGALLFFFTTWCPYCRSKFPELVNNYDGLRSEGIELVAIDAGETKAKVSSFMEKNRVNFDILLDAKTAVSGAYGVVGVPTFVLVDKNGMIVYEGNDLPDNYKEMLNK